MTKSEFIERSNSIHSNRYSYSDVEFSLTTDVVTIACPTHGDFQQVASQHLRGHGCKQCQAEKMRLTTEEFIEKSSKQHGNFFTYPRAEYVNQHTDIVITCPTHGDFTQNPNNHMRGWGCPKCANTVSSHEKKILEDFPEFEQVNRTVIHPQHLDLYSEKHNLAVEVNGVYWHSEDKGKDAKYHISKTDRCLEKGIILLHFWDYEIKTKYQIVKSMIDSRFGTNKRVFARKCKLAAISRSDADTFMQTNHLQGKAIHKAAIGLTHDGELVAVMTFGKPRFNKTYEWELIRLATKCGVTVVGGASKLFSEFIRLHKPKSVLSYADRRYSNGKVYETVGFSKVGTSPPSYFYWKHNSIVSRYQAQKHKLSKLLGDKFDSSKTEVQNMSDYGYYRVFDCGTLIYAWKKLTQP